MQLIYLLEGHEELGPSALASITRSLEKGDQLYTSDLALGELLAGAGPRVQHFRAYLDWAALNYLTFDGSCVTLFAELRSKYKVRTPDAIHVACAALFGVDVFYTNDRKLLSLDIPGVKTFTNGEHYRGS